MFIPIVLLLFGISTLTAAETINLVITVGKDTRAFRVAQALADAIGRKMEQKIHVKSFPGKRAWAILKDNKQYHGDIARLDTFDDKLSDLIKIKEPIISISFMVYTRKIETPISSWDSMAGYRVVTVRGLLIYDKLPDDLIVTKLNDTKQALRFLKAGRADFFISHPMVVSQYLALPEFKNKEIRALQAPIEHQRMYTYFQKEHSGIAKRYENALMNLKKEDLYAEIIKDL